MRAFAFGRLIEEKYTECNQLAFNYTFAAIMRFYLYGLLCKYVNSLPWTYIGRLNDNFFPPIDVKDLSTNHRYISVRVRCIKFIFDGGERPDDKTEQCNPLMYSGRKVRAVEVPIESKTKEAKLIHYLERRDILEVPGSSSKSMPEHVLPCIFKMNYAGNHDSVPGLYIRWLDPKAELWGPVLPVYRIYT